MATDPDLIRDILKAPEEEIDKGRFIHKLRPIVGLSSLTISGEEQRRRRHALHATFARGGAQQFVPEMSAVIRQLAAGLVTAGPFNAHSVTAPLTLRMICIVMFGKDVLSPGDEQAIIHAVSLVEDDLAKELFQVLPSPPWTTMKRRRKRAEAREIMDLVVNRVRGRAGSSSALAALQELGLSGPEIRDEIVTMLLAGHHTSGSAAAWLLYYLAVNPELADRLAEEARAVSSNSGDIRPGDLPRASLSLAFVREVLRLYPSAHWFSRDVKKPATLAGAKVSTGDAILISPWHLHRDPRYWDNPHAFNLDRSFGGKAYLPFGAGPRACLGMGIALLELQLLALEIASSFEVVIRSQVPAPWPTSSVTLIPPDIVLEVSLRTGGREPAWPARVQHHANR